MGQDGAAEVPQARVHDRMVPQTRRGRSPCRAMGLEALGGRQSYLMLGFAGVRKKVLTTTLIGVFLRLRGGGRLRLPDGADAGAPTNGLVGTKFVVRSTQDGATKRSSGPS